MSDEIDMSEELTKAIEKAAQDTIASKGGILTGFTCMATFLDEKGERCWSFASQEGQMIAVTLGMLQLMTMTVEGQAACMLFHDHDDEED